MSTRVELFIPELSALTKAISLLNQKAETIMATQAELAASLRAVNDRLAKARTEIVNAIARLQAAVDAGGATTPEVDQALQDLVTSAQVLDDINPDPEPPTE